MKGLLAMSEAFHDDNSEVSDPCGCAWQRHSQSHDKVPGICSGEQYVYTEGGLHELDEQDFWKKIPCTCVVVAPRHFQRRIIGADVVCNCGWYSEIAEPGETMNEHRDREVYV